MRPPDSTRQPGCADRDVAAVATWQHVRTDGVKCDTAAFEEESEREERGGVPFSLYLRDAKYRRTVCIGESVFTAFYCMLIFFCGHLPTPSGPMCGIVPRHGHRRASNQWQQGCVRVTPQRIFGPSVQTGSVAAICECWPDPFLLVLVSLRVAEGLMFQRCLVLVVCRLVVGERVLLLFVGGS